MMKVCDELQGFRNRADEKDSPISMDAVGSMCANVNLKEGDIIKHDCGMEMYKLTMDVDYGKTITPSVIEPMFEGAEMRSGYVLKCPLCNEGCKVWEFTLRTSKQEDV